MHAVHRGAPRLHMLIELFGAHADVYLVTAFVPSDTACLASSPGNRRRTAD